MGAARVALVCLSLVLMSLECSGKSVMVFPRAFKGGVLPKGTDLRGRVERAAREGQCLKDEVFTLVQFMIYDMDPQEFAEQANAFTEALQEIISEVEELEGTSAFVLGMTEMGEDSIKVIVIARTNSTEIDPETLSQYVQEIIEQNQDLFGVDIYDISYVHSGNIDDYTPAPSRGISTGAVVGLVLAGIVLGTVALAVIGLIAYFVRQRSLGEHVPLIPGRDSAFQRLKRGGSTEKDLVT